MRRVFRRVFYYKRTRIYKILTKDVPFYNTDVDVTVVPVCEDNFGDVLTMDSANLVDLFKQMMNDGELGFYAYCGDSMVHHSWVILGPEEIIPGIKDRKSLFSIDHKSAYIHYCVTTSDWRGKGIYPFVLSEICRILDKQLERQSIFITVTGNNVASIRGILKAGFKKFGNIIAINLLGLMIRKIKTIESDQLQISG
jgi:ribosomal protein S18 acetylase RimI-like enzyme